MELFDGHADVVGHTLEYLERWFARFDLFDAERPFMQLPVDPATKENSIAALRLDWASGNNVTLFDHHVDRDPPALTPAAAVRALLTTLLYQPGGGVSKPFNRTDSPGSKAVLVVVEGDSLWETLIANCWEPAPGDEARPAWERDPSTDRAPDPAGTSPRGLLDRLTWQSRAVRLVAAPDGLVRTAYVQQHFKLADGSIGDPFVPLRMDGDETKIVRVSSGRRLWQAADALLGGLRLASGRDQVRETVASRSARLMEQLDPPRHPQLLFSGLRIDQAKIGDAQSALLPVSAALLEDASRLDMVRRATEQAANGAYAVRVGIETFDKCLGHPPNPKLVAQWSQPYWAQLGGRFPQFVGELAAMPAGETPLATDPLFTAWETVVVRAARAAIHAYLTGGSDLPGVPRAAEEARTATERVLRKHDLLASLPTASSAPADDGQQEAPTALRPLLSNERVK
jgi:hypothetical protein